MDERPSCCPTCHQSYLRLARIQVHHLMVVPRRSSSPTGASKTPSSSRSAPTARPLQRPSGGYRHQSPPAWLAVFSTTRAIPWALRFSRSIIQSYLAACDCYCSARRVSIGEQISPSIYNYPRGDSILYSRGIQSVSTGNARRAWNRVLSVEEGMNGCAPSARVLPDYPSSALSEHWARGVRRLSRLRRRKQASQATAAGAVVSVVVTAYTL